MPEGSMLWCLNELVVQSSPSAGEAVAVLRTVHDDIIVHLLVRLARSRLVITSVATNAFANIKIMTQSWVGKS